MGTWVLNHESILKIPIMAKKRNTKKNNGNKKSKVVMRIQQGLDSAGAAYLRLLSDPCAADLVAPTYGGTGSGYLMRTKYLVNAASFVDALLEFTPQFASQYVRLSGTSATGTTLGAATSVAIPSQLKAVASQYRCVAACVKTFYLGSELNRQGIVASSLTAGPYLLNSTTPTGSAATFAEKASRYVRMGTEMHECRWVPAESDQNFVSMVEPETVNTQFTEGSTIQIAVVNAPTSTIQFEVTAVWEWVPISVASDGALNTGGSVVYTPRAPVTAQPLSATLHRIGDVARFATDPNVHKSVAERLSSTLAFAQGVYGMTQAVRSGMAFARNPAVRALGGPMSRLALTL